MGRGRRKLSSGLVLGDGSLGHAGVSVSVSAESKMIVTEDGSRYWHLDNKRHREDGPAVELPSGIRQWWLNGKVHREDGPAIEGPDGKGLWYRNNERHREDGPAVERPEGPPEWWLNGVQYESEQEWLNEMLLRHLAEVVVRPSARSRPSPLAR